MRSHDLKTATSRLKLAVRTKPYFVSLGGGRSLGYGRNKGVGAWVLRTTDGKGGATLKRFAQADDEGEANGVDVLSFRQALEFASAGVEEEQEEDVPARSLAITVGEAINEFELDLAARGGGAGQITTARNALGKALLARPVALLKHRELRRWRDAYLARASAGAVTRVCKTIKAALNFVASQPDNGIKNNLAWVGGLENLPDSNVPRRGMLLTEERVHAIVAACRAHSRELGLIAEVLAVTGCRTSQAARLLVRDLREDGVMLPRSMKGKGKKRMERRFFPLPASTLERLRAEADGRDGDEPLLQRANGGAWTSRIMRDPWRLALKRAGLPAAIPYTLRHTSATRALKSTTAEIVAKSRDTSVPMLERVYGGEIDQVSAKEILGSLIDLG